MPRIRDLAPIALALGCLGCASSVPTVWLPRARELERWPYGASATLTTERGWRLAERGELIALGRDSVHVLTAGGLRAIPCRQVVRVTLQVDRGGRIKTPRLTFRRGSQRVDQPIPAAWESIRPFARFPGGLPDSLDRGALRLPTRR